MQIKLRSIVKYLAVGVWTGKKRQRIVAKQRENLIKLLAIARDQSPLFKELYAHLGENSAVDLEDLPVTRKPELMKNFDRWLTVRNLPVSKIRVHLEEMENVGVPIEGVVAFRTSGTSGEPAIVVLPPASIEYMIGITLARLGFSQLKLISNVRNSGYHVTITGGNGHFAGIGLSRLLNKLFPLLSGRVKFIEAEKPIDQIVTELNALSSVSSLATYPSVLAILTAEKEAGRLKCDPSVIKAGGEALTDELRERVQRAFPSLRGQIENTYACSEGLLLAFQCDHGRQHVNEDWIILEAVDENMKPVADGVLSDSVLLTVLTNHVQPIIRYDLGDRIRYHSDSCPCGSPFRSFEVEGRQAILVHVKERSFSPLVFDLDHELAQRIQMVQVEEEKFELRVRLYDEADRKTVFEHVRRSIVEVFHASGLNDVTVGESLEPPILGASGKFHEVIALKN